MKNPRLVCVEWVDSAGVKERWIGSDETINPTKCVTVGFVKDKTETAIVVCGSISDGGQWGWPIAIPRCSITRMRRIKA